MDTRNSHAGHIGLQTIDRNVDHKRWPCVPHPAEVSCEDAIRLASKKSFRSLAPQRPTPRQDWGER